MVEKKFVESEKNSLKQGLFWHGPVAGALAGAFAGASAAAASYPFAALKKMVQSDQTITARTFIPRTLYRGVGVYTFVNFPATMIQVALSREILYLSGQNTTEHQIFAGLISGFVSGFTLAPVESIMLNQQQQKCGPINALRYLIKSKGPFSPFRGGPATGFRESIYALAILWASEAAGRKLTDISGYNMMLLGALLVSLASAPASHPFDAIATYQQCSVNSVSFIDAARNIFLQKGFYGFYKGLLPRLGVFAVGIPIAVEVKNTVLTRLNAM